MVNSVTNSYKTYIEVVKDSDLSENEISHPTTINYESDEQVDTMYGSDDENYSFFPINNPDLISFFDKQRQLVWYTENIDFSGDRHDWDIKMNDDSKEFIKFWLAFFSQADGIVCENLAERFQRDTSFIKEAGFFYGVQNFMEIIHNKAYGQMIEVFIRDNNEKNKMRNAIKYYPSVRKITDWAKKWMRSDAPLVERVIAFICVEGIMFTGAFCAIYWLKRQNILKGLCQANEWIARDEGIHTEFGIALYHKLINKYSYEPVSEERIKEIVGECMKVVEEFNNTTLRVNLIGMDAESMNDYIKCTANVICRNLGVSESIYPDTINPFPWMTMISLYNKSNFFEKKVSEYSRIQSDTYSYDVDHNF